MSGTYIGPVCLMSIDYRVMNALAVGMIGWHIMEAHLEVLLLNDRRE